MMMLPLALLSTLELWLPAKMPVRALVVDKWWWWWSWWYNPYNCVMMVMIPHFDEAVNNERQTISWDGDKARVGKPPKLTSWRGWSSWWWWALAMVMLIMMILSLHLGELPVLCTEPDVAVRLSHMVPPKNHFHPHLWYINDCAWTLKSK